MRKNKLRIKSSSLKEQTVERLTNGAEGMYVSILMIPTPCVFKSEADTRISIQVSLGYLVRCGGNSCSESSTLAQT